MTDSANASIVPRSKYDRERAEAWAHLSDQEIEPVVKELLEWTFDTNWPIADDVAKALYCRPAVVPAFADLLRSSDASAKWHTLSLMMANMPREVAKSLREELLRLDREPTAIDREEEVDCMARHAVEWLEGRH